jgi:hypothetical protein
MYTYSQFLSYSDAAALMSELADNLTGNSAYTQLLLLQGLYTAANEVSDRAIHHFDSLDAALNYDLDGNPLNEQDHLA